MNPLIHLTSDRTIWGCVYGFQPQGSSQKPPSKAMLSHPYEICQAANLIYETFREMSGQGETVRLAVQRMKDINWSQGLPPSPGKRQIILVSLAFFCIAQIWRATCFTSFDLKRSDVGHKKGSHGIWKRTFFQTCKNKRRKEINLDDTFNFPLLHIFTHKPACMSPILSERVIFTFLTIFHLDCWVSDFSFSY